MTSSKNQKKLLKRLNEESKEIQKEMDFAKGIVLMETIEEGLKTRNSEDEYKEKVERVLVTLDILKKISESFENKDPLDSQSINLTLEDTVHMIKGYGDVLSAKKTASKTNFEVGALLNDFDLKENIRQFPNIHEQELMEMRSIERGLDNQQEQENQGAFVANFDKSASAIRNLGEAFDHFEVPDARGNKFVKELSKKIKKIEKRHILVGGNIGAKQEKVVAQLQKLEEKRVFAKGVALLEALEEGLEKRQDLKFMNEIKSNKNELLGIIESDGFTLIKHPSLIEEFPSLITEPLRLIDENPDILSAKKTSSKTNFEVETLSTNNVALPTTLKELRGLKLEKLSDNSNVLMMDDLSNLGKVHNVEARWVPFISTQTKKFSAMMKFVAEYDSYKANCLNAKSVANEETIKAAVEQNFKGVESKYRPTALNAEAITQSLMKMNRLELKQLRGEFHEYFEQLLNDPNKATILELQHSLPLEGSEELGTILDLGGTVNRVAMKELVKGKRKILKELIESFLNEIPQGQESKSVFDFVGSNAASLHQKLENIARMKSFELSA